MKFDSFFEVFLRRQVTVLTANPRYFSRGLQRRSGEVRRSMMTNSTTAVTMSMVAKALARSLITPFAGAPAKVYNIGRGLGVQHL